MRFVLLLACMLLFAGAARADEVDTIQLRHRTAEQIIPTLQPLLDQGGALTGMQSTLIIRSSRKNIEELRKVVATLDTAPRRLMIYVRQADYATMQRSGARISGRVSSEDTNVRARVLDSTSARDETFDSQVQALEGNPAYIAVGQSVPVTSGSVGRTYDGRIIREDYVEYRDITSGFYVLPRVAGDRVTMDISPQRDTLGNYGRGSSNVQHLNTTAAGRLGEWIELGGASQSAEASGRGILSTRNSSQSGARSVWVKVEELK
jgi:type II secretory pathway component GspD/PulD (secretin)